MDSYLQRRYGWNFFLPLSVGVCLLVIFTQLVYQEFFQARSQGVGTPIAEVIASESQTFRKPNQRFQWETISPGSKLFRKDALRVGEKGFVKFRYENGNEIELEPNSYIVLNETSAFGIDFIEGNAIVRDDKGERQLEKKTGEAPIETTLSATLLSPENSKTFFVRDSKPSSITFNWKLASDDPALLEIATNRQFVEKLTNKIPVTQLFAIQNLSPGRYFWRLKRENQIISVVREFSLVAVSTALPLAPNGEVTSIKNQPSVRFQWSLPEALSDVLALGTHRIQISKKQDFNPIEKELEVALDTEGAEVSSLFQGPGFWRVVSQYGDLVARSQAKAFTHLIKAERDIAQWGNEIMSLQKDSLTPGIELQWKADDVVERYEIEVRSLVDGKIIARIPADGTKANFVPPSSGSYEWRVVGQKANEKVAESSWKKLIVPGDLKIATGGPPSGALILHGNKPKAFDLTWDGSTLPPETTFEVHLGRDREFKLPGQMIKTSERKLSGQQFRLSDDTYFWKVVAFDKQGVALGQSEVSHFRYAEAPPLPPPAPLDLTQGTVWDVLKTRKAPVASWAKIEGAQKYELVVRQGEKTVFRSVTEKTSSDLKHLGDGEFLWSVRAIDEDGRLGEYTEPNVVKVIYPRLPAPKGLRLRKAKQLTGKS